MYLDLMDGIFCLLWIESVVFMVWLGVDKGIVGGYEGIDGDDEKI